MRFLRRKSKKRKGIKMKSAKFIKGVAACAAIIFAVTISPKTAAETPMTERASAPRVVMDGETYEGKVKLIDGVTYIRLREFSEGLGADVTWNDSSATAGVKTRALDLTAKEGAYHMSANGRTLECRHGIFIEDGRMYVPLRALGTAFGFETLWDQASYAAKMTRHREAIEGYDADDLYWLSRIISAEAKGESMSGKMAVGSVVLNRVKSREFPNTIYGVIFDRNGGVQFTPVANGEIYKAPDNDSIEAAKRCLDGQITHSGILFFINVNIADSFWITQNRQYVMTIGNHDFYA